MSVQPTNECCICYRSLGATFKDTDSDADTSLTDFVTAILHQPAAGPAHQAHRICAFEMFQTQLENEPEGIARDDLQNLPFSCPLCREKLSLNMAEVAAGVKLDQVISVARMLKRIGTEAPQQPPEPSCTIL